MLFLSIPLMVFAVAVAVVPLLVAIARDPREVRLNLRQAAPGEAAVRSATSGEHVTERAA